MSNFFFSLFHQKVSPTNLLQQDHPHFPGDLASSPIPTTVGHPVGGGRGGPRSASRLSHNVVMWASNPDDSNDDLKKEIEMGNNPIYEPPPSARQQGQHKDGEKKNGAAKGVKDDTGMNDGGIAKNDSSIAEGAGGTPSESDETAYGGQSSSIYSRAPSQCSSVSATQSFDMRMYGRSKIMQVIV